MDFKVRSRMGDYEVYFKDLVESSQAFTNQDLFFVVDKSLVPQVSGIFASNPFWTRRIEIEAGEESKSFHKLEPVFEHLLELGISRKSKLIAIGGGTVQDVVSFIASTIFRGIEWWFVPTTLLAQGDSCIGGKTSINLKRNKNIVGSFWPPKKIFVDTSFVDTLPDSEYWSGIGELAHYFALSDPGLEELTQFLNSRVPGERLESLVARSLTIKRDVIESDEFDQGVRQLLNFGHTFGHAIESATSFKTPHGIAVSAGMKVAYKLSNELGYLDTRTSGYNVEIVEQILSKAELPRLVLSRFFDAILADKKTKDGVPTLILFSANEGAFPVSLPLDSKIRYMISRILEENFELVEI